MALDRKVLVAPILKSLSYIYMFTITLSPPTSPQTAEIPIWKQREHELTVKSLGFVNTQKEKIKTPFCS